MPPSGPTESVPLWTPGSQSVSRQIANASQTPPAAIVPSGSGPTVAPSPSPLLDDSWSLQFLPEGRIYKAYLASGKETRLSSHVVQQRSGESTWDPTIGFALGLLRYGNETPLWPEGWQLDAEAAVFPRIRMDELHTMVSMDFRVGAPLTWRRGPWETKLGYYHECSHLGDEYMVEQQSLDRSNYMRDSLVWGVAVRPASFARLYAEADWAFVVDDGAKPWHFQFGLDLSPSEPTRGLPYPFLALNTRLRQETNYSGNLTVQTGVQWRTQANRLLRLGLQYFNGLSDQYQFVRQFEQQIGFGAWYDF